MLIPPEGHLAAGLWSAGLPPRTLPGRSPFGVLRYSLWTAESGPSSKYNSGAAAVISMPAGLWTVLVSLWAALSAGRLGGAPPGQTGASSFGGSAGRDPVKAGKPGAAPGAGSRGAAIWPGLSDLYSRLSFRSPPAVADIHSFAASHCRRRGNTLYSRSPSPKMSQKTFHFASPASGDNAAGLAVLAAKVRGNKGETLKISRNMN